MNADVFSDLFAASVYHSGGATCLMTGAQSQESAGYTMVLTVSDAKGLYFGSDSGGFVPPGAVRLRHWHDIC